MRFDNENRIVFRNEHELAETIKRVALRYNNEDKSSPLLTWREFTHEILGMFKNNEIYVNAFPSIYKEENEKHYMLLPIDLFRNGYEMIDCDGYTGDEIPFKKRQLINTVAEDKRVTLSFKLEATPITLDGSYKGTMVEEKEGVYRMKYPHEIQLDFDIILGAMETGVTKFSQLYFYVTDVAIEVLR